MDPVLQKITDGLRKAIEFEGDGHNFYMMAAGNTQDNKGKEVLSMLAREELQHVKFLRHQFKHFMDTGRPDMTLKLPHHDVLKGDHPIFSPSLKERVQEAHMEMSALAIGIQLELNSQQYYRSQSEEHDGSRVGEFYADLAVWEKEHYDALLRQQQNLKEDYWSQGGFAPF
ncbi:ferritin family protein [bacterium]|nr:ferritin family protein [bacterium]